MFRFAHPQYLWLLLAVPALIALYWAAARNRRKRLARFGDPTLLRGLMPEVSTGRVRLKSILFTAAVALLVLALARPQWGSKLREETSEGIEMMLVVDVSNSMLAEDFAPNRLERTKYAIDRLFDGLRQDRVGLVVFAGEPKVQLPITSDYRMAKAFARKIDPSLVAVQGTAVGKALSQALMSFSSETEQNHSRVIVLITDGENHEDDAVAVAERAKELGIRIFTIGIGTPEGAPIRIGGEFIRDEKGDMVVSKLDEQMLQQIADITGGAYVRSSNQSVGLDEIVQSINRMEATELSTVKFEEYNARGVLPARPPQSVAGAVQYLPRGATGVAAPVVRSSRSRSRLPVPRNRPLFSTSFHAGAAPGRGFGTGSGNAAKIVPPPPHAADAHCSAACAAPSVGETPPEHQWGEIVFREKFPRFDEK